MSNLINHAKTELSFLLDGDEMNRDMYDHLIHMVEEFAKEGHSGFSANYAINMLNKILRFEPIRPLTGEDDEWIQVSNTLWQNKRCGRVFKGEDGRAYDIEGKVFVEPNGVTYTSRDSYVYVAFPYTPKTRYVYTLKKRCWDE